ncbi:MBL fold metallo-hydrolase [Wenxinia marina]|uniref:Zn-dependent hydrolase n=1 Tax=Wenxinia marina DSM 24838 TaxID=1123501 RepID=A0A0D0NKQ7_9RHOB|nr:MBL fold metallo-hydrolase [Wenxinia marina]KIQ68905.1 Zn-dependent hydrolase [Wenxinia marina DSM 24838]GGL64313.1 MBL fold hydrolase [Wenxinia marina]
MDEPRADRPVELSPGLVRLVAPNPSPMTYWGTNTYLLGTRSVAVIDPGPDDPAHMAAILGVLDGRPVSHILVTHAHGDHSALAPRLAARTGAPMLAWGRATDGRSPAMQALAGTGALGGGEGLDRGFVPDRTVADGEGVSGDGWDLRVLHTPGHLGSHICLLYRDAAFTGDHVMGWASTLISPPDGDLTDFMASCERLLATGARRYLPGHGPAIDDGPARTRWLMDHRRMREAEILAVLATGPATAATLAARLYVDTPPALLPAAARNVLAHLVDLMRKSTVRPDGPAAPDTAWRLT